MSNKGGESSQSFDFKLYVESLRGDIGPIMDRKLEVIHERIDQLGSVKSASKGSQGRTPLHESKNSNSDDEVVIRPRRNKRDLRIESKAIKGSKMKIPSFQGRSDPDAYLEWEKCIELIFDCNSHTNEQKMKLAIMEFTDYAIIR